MGASLSFKCPHGMGENDATVTKVAIWKLKMPQLCILLLHTSISTAILLPNFNLQFWVGTHVLIILTVIILLLQQVRKHYYVLCRPSYLPGTFGFPTRGCSSTSLNVHYNLSVQTSHHKQNTDCLGATTFKNIVDRLLKLKYSTCMECRIMWCTVTHNHSEYKYTYTGVL